MKNLILTLLAFSVFSPFAFGGKITVTPSMKKNEKMPFIERSSALAMNIQYDDIKFIRSEISKTIKKPLTYLKSWDANGEAHVTTITPPEFKNFLSKYITEQTMNKIARNMEIQKSDLEVIGIGSGTKKFNGENGETFFVIVKSKNLLKIRESIYREYRKAGGPANGFNPSRFFPHITIGFTHSDIHEADGLVKDAAHSLDERFPIEIISNQ